MRVSRILACGLAAALVSNLSAPLAADDVQPGVDGKGRISLTVNFLVPPQGGETRYQDVCESFADALWVASEGNHYLGSMRFVYGAYPSALIDWDYQTSGHSGTASFQSSLHMHENAGFSADSTANLLLHEFGHYFYGQRDEYQRVSWGSIGVCVDDDGLGTPDPDGTPCDDFDPMTLISSDCGAGQYCAPGGTCTADPTVDCEDDSECAGAGVCVWPNEGGGPLDAPMGSSFNGFSICNDETETIAGEGTVSYTCNMANKVSYHRWCDVSRHLNEIVINSSTLDLELSGEDGNPYNCWDRAAARHPTDLGAFHTIGDSMTYTSMAALGPPAEPVDCIWAVDPLSADDHSVLLVDKSGSMSYFDFVGAEAVDTAADGALYFYNKTPNGNYAGVYAYDTGTSTVETLAEKVSDLDAIALNAGGNTNIGQAIAFAVNELVTSAAPAENRNIVLFSDGKSNTGPEDPVAEAAAACAAGINVSTIAYGDADSASLQQIAEAPGCTGFAWLAGTESPDPTEQDPHELKTTLARARYRLLERQEVLERRGAIDFNLAEVTRTFTVPQSSEALAVAWLGNRARVGSTPLFAFNALDFELESPSGTTFTPAAGPPELNGLYRAVSVAAPEVGTWTARVKTNGVAAPGRGELEISWLANVAHPTIRARAFVPERRRALGQPVTIRATLAAGGYLATGLEVSARITHAGNAWQVAMFDDGLHDDEEAGDGLYGGIFDSGAAQAAPGGYRVKVTLEAPAGGAQAARVDTPDSPEDPPENLPVVPQAVVEAETMFRLSRRYTARPDGSTAAGTVEPRFTSLNAGEIHRGLTAIVTGVAAHRDNFRLGLDPGVRVENLSLRCLSCPDTAGEQRTQVTFDAIVDPAARDFAGRKLTVQVRFEILESAENIEIVGGPIFLDGFESGDTQRWSSTVP